MFYTQSYHYKHRLDKNLDKTSYRNTRRVDYSFFCFTFEEYFELYKRRRQFLFFSQWQNLLENPTCVSMRAYHSVFVTSFSYRLGIVQHDFTFIQIFYLPENYLINDYACYIKVIPLFCLVLMQTLTVARLRKPILYFISLQ